MRDRDQKNKEQGKNEEKKVKEIYLSPNVMQQALFGLVHGQE